jgi:uncharacterized protein
MKDVSSLETWTERWQAHIESWVTDQMAHADAGHGIDHVRRVVANARMIGACEGAAFEVVLPSAWLHDCVVVPKNSPDRSKASTLAAESAQVFLRSIAYPDDLIPRIFHCIQSHSFSANIPCETLEASIVQDADRLEALGAIGLSRCLQTGGAMRQRLYHPDEPFPITRQPKDTEQSVDHFFAKLLKLHATMKTESGREEARKRTEFLVVYLDQLAKELELSVECKTAVLNCLPSM